jgi:hypothetical protein
MIAFLTEIAFWVLVIFLCVGAIFQLNTAFAMKAGLVTIRKAVIPKSHPRTLPLETRFQERKLCPLRVNAAMTTCQL